MNFTPNRKQGRLAHLMATTSERLPQNATGRFYVTSACIDCNFCYNEAPAFFRLNEEIGFSIVHRQPTTSAEIAFAQETLEGCPVQAIGAEGE
jgi:ferredoxin